MSVYCAVRNGSYIYIYIILVNHRFLTWPLTAKARFNPRQVHLIFVVDTVALGQVFLRVLQLSPVSNISPMIQLIVIYMFFLP